MFRAQNSDRKYGTSSGNVLRPFAERRDADRHDAQTIVEIFSEAARGDEFVEAAIGGGDDSGGDLDRLLTTDSLKLAVLQHAEQLRLRGFVQISDFVEKDRATVGQLELAASERRRTRERALLVSEQLALDQFGRNRRAVDLDERSRGKRALAVNVRGQQLLARARLADSRTRHIGSRHLRRLLHGVLKDWRRSDHLRRSSDQFAIALVLALQIRPTRARS